jgi:predicted nucleic acid-binding protein
MLLGVDTGFFVSYANHHPRALTIWQELIDGLHSLVVSALTINEILVYFYQRGDSDKGQEWVALMIETDNIEVVPVSVEIAVRSARYRTAWDCPLWTQ